MQATQHNRSRRQPAIRLLAQEYAESTLQEKGGGEFDPAFVVTKLGAKVNRVLVAGLLENLAPRETGGGGTMWQGQLRDPSGLHYFSIGDFQSEEVQTMAAALANRLEEGDPLLLMMVAKTRLFTSDDGAVYTSLRPEEMSIVDRSVYGAWLVEASKATMSRVSALEATKGLEASRDAFLSAGAPEGLVEGMVLSRNHYGDVDPEVYKLTVMRALDIAEGRDQVQELPNKGPRITAVSETSPKDKEEEGKTEDVAQDEDVLRATIQDIIRRGDQGEGVDLAMIIKNCEARGFEQSAADAAIDDLIDAKVVDEVRFGWFRLNEG